MTRTSAPSAGPTTTRERILDVAQEIISRHGMEGLRLKDVAQRVGIQPPSIFAHFEGREAIGDAVAHRVLDQIATVLERSLRGKDLEAQLRAGVREIAGHLYDHPGHTRLILRDLARTRSGPELELTSPAMDRIGATVDGLLEKGRQAGRFRELPPGAFMPVVEGALVATIGWAGFVEDDGAPAVELTREQVQDRLEDLVVAYLRPA